MSEGGLGVSRPLPSAWKVVRLDEAFDVLDKRRKPLNKRERTAMQGDIPYYGANGVVDHIAKWLFDQPLVLVAEDGGYFDEYATRHIAYLVEGKCWVNNHAHVLAAKLGLSREWLFYNLQHRDIRPYINSGTRTKLNQADLRRIPMPLPPLPEQRKIAAILSSVDEVIENTEAVIEQLQVVKKAMMQELLTRGIPGRHTRFKQTEIGEIPEEWEVARMEAIAVEPRGMVGGPFGSDLTAGDYVDVPGVPVIRGSDISPGSFVEDDFAYVSVTKAETLRKNGAQRGDFIMTQRGASLGQAALIPGDSRYEEYIVSQTMMRLRPDHAKMLPQFLLHYVCSQRAQTWLQKRQIGNAQPHLNLTIFREMPALVPSLHEQRGIAKAIDSVDGAITANSRERYVQRKTKSALLSVLLTGEVRVTPDEDAA
jgi:type I restriction enzyme, S subunit